MIKSKKGKTISDWVIGLDSRENKLADRLHSVKKQDNLRLANSGLPVYAVFGISYADFLKKPKSLIDFFNSYDMFCVRALPRTSQLPRRYKLRVKSLEEATEFLKSVVGNKIDIYDVLANEQQDQKFAGMIILKPDMATVEIGRSGLDRFSHGEGKRYVGIFNNEGLNKFRARKFLGNYKRPITLQIKTLMNRALRCIKSTKIIDNKGYFEFIVTDKNEIKFLDYKISEGYV
jgi:hypothetical protein